MTTSNPVLSASEFRAIWVYSLNVPDADWGALLSDMPASDGPKPLAAALGLDALDTDFIDFLVDSELSAMALSDLLVNAHGMDRASVAPDAAKLDQLRGQVLLVHSSALGTRTPSVEPAPPLTFVGRYAEALKNESTPMGTVKSAIESAETDAPSPPQPAKKKPSDAAMSGRVATIALLVMALLVWVMIRVAG